MPSDLNTNDGQTRISVSAGSGMAVLFWVAIGAFIMGNLCGWYFARNWYLDRTAINEREYQEITQKNISIDSKKDQRIQELLDLKRSAEIAARLYKEKMNEKENQIQFLKDNPTIETVTKEKRIYIKPEDCEQTAQARKLKGINNEISDLYNRSID